MSASDQGATGMRERWGLRRDSRPLLILAVAAAVLHGWLIVHTGVPARDAVGYIHYAWRLQHEPWPQVLRTSLQPPLYPLSVAAISLPLQAMPFSQPLKMQYAAQGGAALAAVLLTVPMYFLGRRLFNRRVGFWSALLFQCLPVSAHVLSDGLSEALYLLLAASFLLLAACGLQRRSSPLLGAAGIVSGLAYLARPEGAGLALVLLMMLGAGCFVEKWKPQQAIPGAAAVLLGALLSAGPYVSVIHGFSNKTTAVRMWGSLERHSNRPHEVCSTPTASIALPMATIGTWHPGWQPEQHCRSIAWAVNVILSETGKTFHYVAWLPALLGMWWFRKRLRASPVAGLLILALVLHALVLLRMALVAGYVSERHTLFLVMCCMPWAVAGVLELPRHLLDWIKFVPGVASWRAREGTMALSLLVALVLFVLPNSLRSMHRFKLGFRDAGLWLAAHADPADVIVDPFGWSEYYAGRVIPSQPVVATMPNHVPCYYVVLDGSPAAAHHSALPLLAEATAMAERGEQVYHWPTNRPADTATVRIFEVLAIPSPKPTATQAPSGNRRPGTMDGA